MKQNVKKNQLTLTHLLNQIHLIIYLEKKKKTSIINHS